MAAEGAVLVRKRKKPLEVKAGAVTVKVYRTTWRDKKRRRIYASHVVSYFDQVGRHRHKFADRSLAEACAQDCATALINGEISSKTLSREDLALIKLAKELSIGLLELREYHEAKQTLEGTGLSVGGATSFAARLHPKGLPPKSIPVIKEEMIVAREKDGASRNSLDDWESRLGRFAKDFTCPVLDVTAEHLNAWLRKLPVAKRTRNNYRGNLVDFYRFAKERGYVPKTWSVLDEVPRVKNEQVVIEVFTPEEITKLFAARANIEEQSKIGRPGKTMIPYMAIGAFAGLRHEEMSSPGLPVLDWRAVDFEKEEIWVPADVARKIGHDRIVPMQPNLVAWLKPYAKRNGPICEIANTTNALARAAAAAGIAWKSNGLRKSFISYRLAITDNIGQVAREAGTSPDRIRHNYQKTQPKREAKRWFETWPTAAEILQLPLFGQCLWK